MLAEGPRLIVSLPANSPELARAAVDGGAEALKVHLHVRHDASGTQFGNLAEERANLERILALGRPTGIVPGAGDHLPTPEEMRALAEMGVDFFDLYVHDTPAWLVRFAGMTRAARIARRAGIPVIGDFESHGPEPFEELLSLTDHLVVPRDFARELAGTQRGAAAVRALWDSSRSAVVVTAGADGAWFACRDTEDRIYHQPAFFVDVEDSTGCGDVFHGAYAAALAQGLGMKDRVRFASAAAALKASRSGGQKSAPSRAEVDEFLSRRAGDAVCREADRGAF